MDSIFIVTQGESSTYRIDSVFSTRKLAEAYVEKIHLQSICSSLFQVEEHPLDDMYALRIAEGESYLWTGYVDRNTSTVRQVVPARKDGWITSDQEIKERKQASWFGFSVTVLARGREHAGQVIADRVARINKDFEL